MKHGIVLAAPTIAEQARVARRAEQAGFDSAWTIEFFNQNGHVRLAAVAAATESITVGNAIAYAFMRTPLLTASAAMDIDELSGGRMVLGLGSGTRSMNERWYSSEWQTPAPARMKEVVALVRAAFAASGGGGLKFEGEFYSASVPLYARPGMVRDSIPVYVAGVARPMVRAAAAVADGLVGHPVYTRKYIADSVLPILEGSDCELAPYVICSVSDDVEQARNEARMQIAFYFTTRLYHTILDAHGWRDRGEVIAAAFKRMDFAAMTAEVSDEMIDAIAITGRPDEVRDQLRQWDGLSEQVLLYPPTVGVADERVSENLDAMVDAFAVS